MRKRIGIVGWFTGMNSFGVSKSYSEYFSHFGNVEILTPWENEVRDLDLLVLPGGADVFPLRYGEHPDIYCGQPNMVLEKFDLKILPLYIEKKVPIFGICRGMQSLNVTFGGTLNQHIYHETNPEGDGSKKMHKAIVINDLSFLNYPHIPKEFDINSRHHQSIKDLAKTAKPLLIYQSFDKKTNFDSAIEAITFWPEYPAHAVQYHPEDINDYFSSACIYHLLSLNNAKN